MLLLRFVEYCLQVRTEYLRLIEVFMRNSTLPEKFSIFHEFFASADKIFISGGGLSTWQQLYEVLRFP